ncbi:DUF1707 SHOCT-like domain-containing protein [Streptomyces iconiensis]|uniref:DUF1707 domain-containing protein n=1 Tax=Streptomyces iconiensis TaxID=1384038 RepID=A0ABT7A8V7_9ACTN|nr:DUF1707 domain-containing protein [Streptomyces iconiensis]MDJ1137424.1 DUF1707 domain-containing protein [Streptomyces iconiensis]
MTAEHRSPAPTGGLRASHADRDEVVERLRDAAAEGRLELDELEGRLEKALTAKTFADLEPLTADLPADTSPENDAPLVLKGGVHGVTRAGRWRVPPHITAHGGMGGIKLDFTRTECRLPVIEIEVHGQMAGVTLIVPPEWEADTDGVEPGIGGLKDKTTPDRAPGAPLVRLTGTGGMGGVTIRHPGRVHRLRHG